MIEVLHGTMLLPTSVGVCCAVAAPRADRAQGAAVGLAMLVAMADFISKSPLLPVFVWAALLLLLAISLSAITSIHQRKTPVPGEMMMATHRGLGLVLTAMLLFGGSSGPVAVSGHHHGTNGSIVVMAVVFAVLSYVLFTAVTISRGLHTGPRQPSTRPRRRQWVVDGTIDIVAMTTGTFVMAVMILLPA